jgi:hypothetical protein
MPIWEIFVAFDFLKRATRVQPKEKKCIGLSENDPLLLPHFFLSRKKTFDQ